MPAWAVSLQHNIDSLKVNMDEATTSFEKKISSLLEPVTSETLQLRETVSELTKIVHTQQSQIGYLRSKHKATTDRLIKLESYSMRENLIFSGLEEIPGETEEALRDALLCLVRDEMGLDPDDISIVRCHRLGNYMYRSSRTGPRDVIARFSAQNIKKSVLFAARKLRHREKPLYITNNFPKRSNKKRRVHRPVLKLARDMNKKASLVHSNLIIQGRTYTTDNLSAIPLDTTKLGTTISDTSILFSGRYSPYSNFLSMPGLFDENGIMYCSSEQYCQHAKAKHTGNDSIAMEILSETEPSVIKWLCDSIEGDTSTWADISVDIMKQCLLLKFVQNPGLRELMEQSGTKPHVECNKYDLYWGTGLMCTDPEADDPSKWKGQNKLGQVLDSVRTEITAC